MVLPSDGAEFQSAWRALAAGNASATEGWRTIAIGSGAPCSFRAGRRDPGDEEALVVGFRGIRIPDAERLPQARGFAVTRADLGVETASHDWVALCRNSVGSLELFCMMVGDIVLTLTMMHGAAQADLLAAFLERIRSWQEFMQRDSDGVLSAEEELGLMGELSVLEDIVRAGVVPTTALAAWRGPLDGLQDFALGSGAIEVKTSLSSQGFRAVIFSLEQLDDSAVRPIFLAAVRLALDETGSTLPESIAQLRTTVFSAHSARALLDSRLLRAGYADSFASRYTRRFNRVAARILRVDGKFPRLTCANVPLEIRRARYEIDLDLISASDIKLSVALKELRVH